MSFKKNKYIILKNVISKELASFVFEYFLLKRQVASTLFEEEFIPSHSIEWGTWNDPQVPNTYSHYADVAMEILLLKIKPLMEKHTKLKLKENYSYARIYKKGDILARHKDRLSCEISTTLNLGGDSWPIFLEPSGKTNKKGICISLKQGDMLVYRGCDLEHWRDPFKGNTCAQVFLHYNDIKNKNIDVTKYDGRIHLGLPDFFKNYVHRKKINTE
jgi:hypothetical protein